ncbi:hypothetical protein BGZ63DRAFT_401990 [Mariannaea sp. PMI_226]|nr:hypothetical protein BGZ63DRAFT_401990 [Mariannaea sp. PMI_226]
MLSSGLLAAVLLISGIEAAVPHVRARLAQAEGQPAKTTVFVNNGCVLMNDSPRCASGFTPLNKVYQNFYDVLMTPGLDNSSMLILSGFDSTKDNRVQSSPTLMLNAVWPAAYQQVFFGEDGCLYDASSNKIYDQCSIPIPQDSDYDHATTNPYSAPHSPVDSQWYEESVSCTYSRKSSCVTAASRYMNDVVYREYTSAVQGADGFYAGCTVIFECREQNGYANGMTGLEIKKAINDYIFGKKEGQFCGKSYFTSSCYVKVDDCYSCRDKGRADAFWTKEQVDAGQVDDFNFTD